MFKLKNVKRLIINKAIQTNKQKLLHIIATISRNTSDLTLDTLAT